MLNINVQRLHHCNNKELREDIKQPKRKEAPWDHNKGKETPTIWVGVSMRSIYAEKSQEI
jgi:hypothetical protein